MLDKFQKFGFPGLRPGDHWCLCAPRWQEALEASQVPRVVLRAYLYDDFGSKTYTSRPAPFTASTSRPRG
jgi:hypothetical protein